MVAVSEARTVPLTWPSAFIMSFFAPSVPAFMPVAVAHGPEENVRRRFFEYGLPRLGAAMNVQQPSSISRDIET
jgi:hypothetical protein